MMTRSIRSTTMTRRLFRCGVGMVEALISLSLSAMLLAAVAAAFTGSARAIEVNDQYFRATQTARVSLNQIITELRQCDTAQVSQSPRLQIDVTTFNNSTDRSYYYAPPTQAHPGQLWLIDNMSAAAVKPQYLLAEYVSSATFTAVYGPSPDGSGSTVTRLVVDLLIEVPDHDCTTLPVGHLCSRARLHLTGSVAPRAAHVYN